MCDLNIPQLPPSTDSPCICPLSPMEILRWGERRSILAEVNICQRSLVWHAVQSRPPRLYKMCHILLVLSPVCEITDKFMFSYRKSHALRQGELLHLCQVHSSAKVQKKHRKLLLLANNHIVLCRTMAKNK